MFDSSTILQPSKYIVIQNILVTACYLYESNDSYIKSSGNEFGHRYLLRSRFPGLIENLLYA